MCWTKRKLKKEEYFQYSPSESTTTIETTLSIKVVRFVQYVCGKKKMMLLGPLPQMGAGVGGVKM